MSDWIDDVAVNILSDFSISEILGPVVGAPKAIAMFKERMRAALAQRTCLRCASFIGSTKRVGLMCAKGFVGPVNEPEQFGCTLRDARKEPADG